MSGDNYGYIAGLDVGTTTIRCQILNNKTNIVGQSFSNVTLIYPKPGYVEINPNDLYTEIKNVIKNAIIDSSISVQDVKSIGISTQRGTFMTWKRDGTPLHDFITWKDVRTKTLVREANNYFSVKSLKWIAYFLYIFTRSTKFYVGSRLNFTSSHASIRLLWALSCIPELKKAIKEKNVMFGTIDTWLIYKFTKGQTYATDITNASATGLYDPFDLKWGIITSLLKVPVNILPPVVANDYKFGEIHESIFGAPIKIGCVISDQSASLIGSCCFKPDDLKVTLGTGSFLNINTGNKIHPSGGGMYPVIAWQLNNNITYMSEVPCNDCGSLMEWALSAELLNNPRDSSDMANSVKDNDGVYYIAAFSGLGPPINNETAAAGFLGIKPSTKKEHMVRAILESIVFRIALNFYMLRKERPKNYTHIRVDGGVSKNDFVCQMLADVTELKVERPTCPEVGVLGVVFLAGVSCGMWKAKEDLKEYTEVDKVFTPSENISYRQKCKNEMDCWLRSAKRFMSWYTD